MLGAAAGGLVQGLTGFAFGLVALTFWAWVLEPSVAGPLVVLGSSLGHLFSLGRARRGFHFGRMAPMLAGGLVGVPIGVILLHHVSVEAFRLGVGALLVVYCPAMLLSHRVSIVARAGPAADAVAGIFSGILGGLGGLAGSVSTLWCTLRGWNRDELRAVFQSFNFAVQVAALVAYAVTGILTRRLMVDFALAAVPIAVMAFAGGYVYAKLSAVRFRQVILMLLAVSGLVMIVSSLSPHGA